MIVIHCRFVIDPRDREAWVESSQRMALASRAEDGCLGYAFSFDVIDPNVAYAYEAWASQELLDAHIAAPHHVARAKELEAWNIDFQQITFWGVDWERDVLAERRARQQAAH
jgi:quinol monooxygenase YgiN